MTALQDASQLQLDRLRRAWRGSALPGFMTSKTFLGAGFGVGPVASGVITSIQSQTVGCVNNGGEFVRI